MSFEPAALSLQSGLISNGERIFQTWHFPSFLFVFVIIFEFVFVFVSIFVMSIEPAALALQSELISKERGNFKLGISQR